MIRKTGRAGGRFPLSDGLWTSARFLSIGRDGRCASIDQLLPQLRQLIGLLSEPLELFRDVPAPNVDDIARRSCGYSLTCEFER